MAASGVSNEERLFSLVLALLATESGLTKADVLSTVQGYRQRYRAGGDNASLERQFERDKDDVRDLGVPLETIETGPDAGAAQFTRYRIPKGGYDLPAELTFTPQEIALLNLAAVAWREGSLSGDSRRALTKLRSLGVAAEDPLVGYAPRLRARDAAFDPLNAALERCQTVAFRYLKPGDARARDRVVAPLALVRFAGRWYVYGQDHGRGRPRTFLLSRVVGAVEPTGERFAAPPGNHAADALESLRAVAAAHTARIRIDEGTDAAARLVRRGTVTADGDLELHYADTALLADELASFGPELVVLGPSELADAVRDRLRTAARQHRGSARA